jgi:predicted glycogen debranching enzyme
MKMELIDEQKKALEYLTKKEWWITNQKGGWASSTIINANTSKYHGLFVVSKPDGTRTMLVPTMDEFVFQKQEKYPLSTHFYKDAIYPEGYKNIYEFEFDGDIARWGFKINDSRISKEIWCTKQKNQTYIRYTLLEGSPIGLQVIPLICARDINFINKNKIELNDIDYSFRIIRIKKPFEWHISINKGNARQYYYQYYNFFYEQDFQKEEECLENLFSIASLETYLTEGQFFEICFYTEPTPYFDKELIEDLKNKKNIQIEKRFQKIPNELKALIRTSEAYLIKPDDWGVCAGYPYFWQWARDTFISLPGLCLPLNKKDIFLQITQKWLKYSKNGILPNRIEDKPIYESIDGMLWLVWAVVEFEKKYSLPKKIKEKITKELEFWFEENEFFRLDKDGLIYLKQPRLTWMDTKINNIAYTPRIGKAIEINALWIYALKNLIRWGEEDLKEDYIKARNSIKKFVTDNYLLDVAEPIDNSFRPNQIIAFSLVDEVFSKYKSFLENIRAKLFVPEYGFYSLSPEDKNFVYEYKGNQEKRDKAYHNGAIWPFFIGHYTQAAINCSFDKNLLEKDIFGILKNINSKALLQIPEIYDQKSLSAQGCPLQAWSVAETIRAAILVYENKNKKIKSFFKTSINTKINTKN